MVSAGPQGGIKNKGTLPIVQRVPVALKFFELTANILLVLDVSLKSAKRALLSCKVFLSLFKFDL